MARTNVGAAAKTSPRAVREAERTLETIKYRKAGLSYDAIAAKMGDRSRSAPFKRVMKYLNKLAKECTEEAAPLRALEALRLDDLYAVAVEHVAEGSETAIDRTLRVMERRAKLLGLDAAEKVDVSGDIVIIDDIPRKSEGAPQK